MDIFDEDLLMMMDDAALIGIPPVTIGGKKYACDGGETAEGIDAGLEADFGTASCTLYVPCRQFAPGEEPKERMSAVFRDRMWRIATCTLSLDGREYILALEPLGS